MKINFLHCSPPNGKNRTRKLINSAKQMVKEIAASFNSTNLCTTSDNTSSSEYLHVDNLLSVNGNYPSMTNTASDMNISNVFEQNPKMVTKSSFLWPEVNMTIQACDGHECLKEKNDNDEKILYQPYLRALKPKFTPPCFPKSGIKTCPNINLADIQKESVRPLIAVNGGEGVPYTTPGNMEFMAFNYPKIDHTYRYSTFAVPNKRFEWEWIYNYIYRIRKSFQRKYLCDLRLASEPGLYKGKVAYLVRIESGNQGNILRCRSGLPNILKDILVIPFNAISDINCYITEYLIKRKYIFKSVIAHRMIAKEELNYSNYESTAAIITEPINQMKEYGKDRDKIVSTMYDIKTLRGNQRRDSLE